MGAPQHRYGAAPPAFIRPNTPGGLIGLFVPLAIGGGRDTGIGIAFSSHVRLNYAALTADSIFAIAPRHDAEAVMFDLVNPTLKFPLR